MLVAGGKDGDDAPVLDHDALASAEPDVFADERDGCADGIAGEHGAGLRFRDVRHPLPVSLDGVRGDVDACHYRQPFIFRARFMAISLPPPFQVSPD